MQGWQPHAKRKKRDKQSTKKIRDPNSFFTLLVSQFLPFTISVMGALYVPVNTNDTFPDHFQHLHNLGARFSFV